MNRVVGYYSHRYVARLDVTHVLVHVFLQVFRIAYNNRIAKNDIEHHKEMCRKFVEAAALYMPEFSRRLKVHLILHLVDCIADFGPATCFSTERSVN